MGAFSQDGTILESTMETGIIEDTCIDSDGHGLADWEEEAIRITSDPATNPAIKRALVDALERDPLDAVRDADTIYQILLQRALAQSGGEWKWRSQPPWCWVCNPHNTRLVDAPGYGIVHECMDCSDQFSLDGAIQWVA